MLKEETSQDQARNKGLTHSRQRGGPTTLNLSDGAKSPRRRGYKMTFLIDYRNYETFADQVRTCKT